MVSDSFFSWHPGFVIQICQLWLENCRPARWLRDLQDLVWSWYSSFAVPTCQLRSEDSLVSPDWQDEHGVIYTVYSQVDILILRYKFGHFKAKRRWSALNPIPLSTRSLLKLTFCSCGGKSSTLKGMWAQWNWQDHIRLGQSCTFPHSGCKGVLGPNLNQNPWPNP